MGAERPILIESILEPLVALEAEHEYELLENFICILFMNIVSRCAESHAEFVGIVFLCHSLLVV